LQEKQQYPVNFVFLGPVENRNVFRTFFGGTQTNTVPFSW